LFVALQVSYLLGGGADFSSGGPGKGMHSRLYQNVLTKFSWVTNCSAYHNIFENSGLIGIIATTKDVKMGALLPGIICMCVPTNACCILKQQGH
jgi:processing peptidase subunit alpha